VLDRKELCFVGDDRRPRPRVPERYDSLKAIREHDKAELDWEKYHFPGLEAGAYVSRPYLAAIVLGGTTWTEQTVSADGERWHCQYDDLTEEGKALYQQIAKLYPDCDLHLLTFVDT